MKHFTLENGTVLKSEKQTAETFRKLHKKAWFINKDVEACKKIVIENSDHVSWYANGISVTLAETTSRFNKNAAIKLLEKLGATEKQIADLTTTGTRDVVKLPAVKYEKKNSL